MTQRSGDDPLKNIVFISLPEDFERTIGDLTVDSSILMPVELPPGGQEWTPSELSWEMIVAGMLKILAYEPAHKDADYYRRFILEVKPAIVDELSNTGILKARNKDFDVAEEIFKALSSLLPEDINSLLNLALVYEDHAEAYDQIGNERLKEICIERAFETYKQAAKIDPESPEVHYNAGYFHLKQRNYSKVIEHFTSYLEQDNDSDRADRVRKIIHELRSHDLLDNLFKEAYDFIRLGKEREGIKKIKAFIDSHPDVWNAWFLLGWAHRRLGEYEKGREAFERAMELGSTETDTFNELAICLMETGKLVESRRQLMKALQMEPENIKILSNLGIVSMKEEKIDEAVGYFEAVRTIEPDDPIAGKYLEILNDQ
jgi:tetratricopeptide (TPR) repeat protein